MAFNTTAIQLSTTPTQLLGRETTWANTKGAGGSDPTPFILFNDNAVRVYVSGSSSTAATGFPVLSSAYYILNSVGSDPLWGFTSASTATVIVQAGRQ